MAEQKQVTFKAPVNIAVVKYWGKRDEVLNLPLNSSLSVTLGLEELCAKTTVSLSKKFNEDKFWLNGREEDVKENKRIQKCLREIRRLSSKRKIDDKKQGISNFKVHICSENNFPTAAGLASSAAGYACLVSALAKLYGIDGNLSHVARQGSGSACRSMYGGFVKWNKGEQNDGHDSIATEIASENHWPELRVLILVVNDHKKTTSSTVGMQRSSATSELLKYRAKNIVPKRMREMEAAIIDKDFDKFAELTMKESSQFHAICLDTYPPISPPYLNETSHQIIEMITLLNRLSGRCKAAYTFDAGPNAFIFTTTEYLAEVLGLLKEYFRNGTGCDDDSFVRGIPIDSAECGDAEIHENIKTELDRRKFVPTHGKLKYIIHTKCGSGPEELSESDSLLNELGLPSSRTVSPST